jgi:hypothetical protein
MKYDDRLRRLEQRAIPAELPHFVHFVNPERGVVSVLDPIPIRGSSAKEVSQKKTF